MLLREAQAGSHLTSDDHTLVVLVPDQNNFEMPLRVEVWAEPPPRDVWRVQLWPTRRNLPDRRIRAWHPPGPATGPVLPITQAR